MDYQLPRVRNSGSIGQQLNYLEADFKKIIFVGISIAKKIFFNSLNVAKKHIIVRIICNFRLIFAYSLVLVSFEFRSTHLRELQKAIFSWLRKGLI
ncbi:MAG: hypothetical protein CFE23_08015 [Flavobacterium sp. BFFFF1]|nr:MAG: hypothetical protein CFE23_08015 [Flavobacterium sp. BFFFF1]